MFTLELFENSARSLSPFPPAPIPAIFNLSLGATKPRPNTCLGTIKKPAPANEAFLINFLLENFSFIIESTDLFKKYNLITQVKQKSKRKFPIAPVISFYKLVSGIKICDLHIGAIP